MLEAAQQQHEDEIAGVRPVGQQRIGQPGRDRQQRAADRAEHGSDDEGVEAIAAHADADERGLVGVLADGAQAQPERRADDAAHGERGEGQQRQRVVIEGPGEEADLVELREGPAEQQRAQHAQALVAAGERVELVEERVEQHPERQRQHAEVDLHVADAQEADRHGDHGRQPGGGRHDRLERQHAVARRQAGGGVGAEGDEQRVAERQQAGGAEEQVEAEQRDAVGERGQQQRHLVRRRQQRRQRQQRRRRQREAPADHGAAPAKRPAGRSTRTPMTTT